MIDQIPAADLRIGDLLLVEVYVTRDLKQTHALRVTALDLERPPGLIVDTVDTGGRSIVLAYSMEEVVKVERRSYAD